MALAHNEAIALRPCWVGWIQLQDVSKIEGCENVRGG